MVEQQPQQISRGNLVYPDQVRNLADQLHSIVKMISDIPQSLPKLRRIFRGEVMFQSNTGESYWIQQTKPIFIKIDFKTGEPLKKEIITPEKETKMIYVVNDEAIEEILSMLSFMGLNEITPITNLSEDNILDDLKEFELKLGAVLTLKQKEWGLEKETMPMTMTKIKTIVQDVRYMACQGGTLKSIQTTVQRMEQVIEQTKPKSSLNPF